MAAGAGFRARCATVRAAAGDWPARFAVLDEMLTARLAGGPASPPSAAARGEVSGEVRHAWRRLLAAEGRCPVSRLAAETGWSERHLRGPRLGPLLTRPAHARDDARQHRTRQPHLLERSAAGRPPRSQAPLAPLVRPIEQLDGCEELQEAPARVLFVLLVRRIAGHVSRPQLRLAKLLAHARQLVPDLVQEMRHIDPRQRIVRQQPHARIHIFQILQDVRFKTCELLR